MRVRRSINLRRTSGQALVETILLMPLILLLVLNVVNFGYFFVVALNLAASPRSGVEYSILGFATPTALTLPAAGPPSTATTVSHLSQQDLTGAISSPTGATIQVCSSTIGMSLSGTTLCVSCTGSTCGAAGAGSPAPALDPEAPNFILHRVDVNYTFSPPIPGTPFGLALLPIPVCSSSGGTVTCTFHRQVSMRAMN
ncbi:MAG TPA: TadE/TadG family type IV pilus assembly protein [Terriglobales bacterium]|nr:TadE/TadG family type IV pilus assembly protein [Terriglobales bacterium]